MKVDVYNYKGKKIEKIDIDIKVRNEISEDLLSQYVRVYQMNQRQGTSKTKTKSEVSGGGKKPWKQKGLGKARAGSIRSPLWRGGGIVHGPSPKSWNLKFNKKMNKALFATLLVKKINENSLSVFVFEKDEKKPYSTGSASKFLNTIKLGERVLIIHDDKALYKSFRNLPFVDLRESKNVCAYDLILAGNVLVEKNSVKSLVERTI